MHRHEAISAIRAARFGSLDEAKQFGSGILIPAVTVSVRQDNDLGQYIFTLTGPGANVETVQTPIDQDGKPGPVQQPDGSAPLAGGARTAPGDEREGDDRNNQTAMSGGDVVAVGPDGNQNQQTGVPGTGSLSTTSTTGTTGSADTATTGTGTDYESMTVDQLKALLDERNVDYPSDARKADLVSLAKGSE